MHQRQFELKLHPMSQSPICNVMDSTEIHAHIKLI